MNDDDMTMDKIWKDVERGLDENVSVKRRALQKGAFLDAVVSGKRVAPRTLLLVPAAATVFLAGLIAVYWMQSEPDGLEFRVLGSDSVGTEGMWIDAKEQGSAIIEFENGSRMRLGEKASARVISSSLNEVRMEILKGAVTADIEGNGRTRWLVQAGPYEVAVLGTTYAVYWDAQQTNLQVKVKEGSVLVKGAGLKEHGIKLTAGNHLSTDGRDVRVAMSASRSLEDFPKKDLEAPAAADGETSTDAVTQKENSIEDVKVDEAPVANGSDSSAKKIAASMEKEIEQNRKATWISLLDEGKFNRAVEEAEQIGLEKLAATADLDSLWKLGNATRYTKRGAAARKILEAVRRRFGESAKAKTAAFLLGRIELELEHDPAAARDWFLKYLTEEPTGRLAEEAWGRLINVYKTLGADQKALDAAKAYLSQYPGGLFAKSAEATISEWESTAGRQ